MTKTITEFSREELLDCTLELGKCMVQSGAEVRRVEDTVTRVMRAYGAASSEVFSISSLVLATIKWKDGSHMTQSKRIDGFGTNLHKLEMYNALARYICRKKPQVEEIRKRMGTIAKGRKVNWLDAACYMLSAGMFAVFFGGSYRDGISAGILGLFVFFFDQFLNKAVANKLVYTLFASLLTGWLAILAVKLGIGENLDKIMIGDIMLFIPTLALCNSLKDMLYGDIITGIYRSIEALLIAAAIGGGFFIANVTCGGGLVLVGMTDGSNISQIVRAITVVGGTVGFSLYFRIDRPKLWTAALGGAIAWGGYLAVYMQTDNLFMANAVGAIAICLYSEIAARVLKAPANIFLIPAVVALLPGGSFYQSVAALINGDIDGFILFVQPTLETIIGIEVGFLVAFILFTKTYTFFKEGILHFRYNRYRNKKK